MAGSTDVTKLEWHRIHKLSMKLILKHTYTHILQQLSHWPSHGYSWCCLCDTQRSSGYPESLALAEPLRPSNVFSANGVWPCQADRQLKNAGSCRPGGLDTGRGHIVCSLFLSMSLHNTLYTAMSSQPSGFKFKNQTCRKSEGTPNALIMFVRADDSRARI